MCVVSMIHDHYEPLIPKPDFWIPWQPAFPDFEPSTPPPPTDLKEIERVRKLLEDFRKAHKAAAEVDKLTKQPDCVDPEKAKLEERVVALEQKIEQLLTQLKAQNTPAPLKLSRLQVLDALRKAGHEVTEKAIFRSEIPIDRSRDADGEEYVELIITEH